MKNNTRPTYFARPATPLDNRTDDAQPLRLLDQVRARIRVKHYALRTEHTYIDWIKRHIKHFDKRHPRELTAAHVERYLSHLATERGVAASTHHQAKSALLFLYKEVLGMELPWLDDVTQAKLARRLPVVLTQAEVARMLAGVPPGPLKLHLESVRALHGRNPARWSGSTRNWPHIGAVTLNPERDAVHNTKAAASSIDESGHSIHREDCRVQAF